MGGKCAAQDEKIEFIYYEFGYIISTVKSRIEGKRCDFSFGMTYPIDSFLIRKMKLTINEEQTLDRQ